MLQRALAIREKALGPEHALVVELLNSLANTYKGRSEYAKAEPLYQRALAIREKTLDPEHPNVALSLNNLANLYMAKGDYVKAEPLYQRSLAIREKTLGPEHPDVANSLTNLAILYVSKGDYAKAEPLYQRALAIQEKTLGPEHPNVAGFLNTLANLYRDKGDYAKAEPMLQHALAIQEKTLGPEHPEGAASLNDLANLYAAKGDVAQALAIQVRANKVSEHLLGINLATGSERQKLAYLATRVDETDRSVSLHVRAAPNDATARNLATTTILQRKGRALDATADSIGTLRRRFNAQDQALLDQWQDTNAQLARLVLGGPLPQMTPAEHQQQMKALEEQKEKDEAQISRRSAEFRAQSQAVTLQAIQAALPPQTALVEFYSYRPFNAKSTKRSEQFGPPHYVAYVLHQAGEVQWVELGAAQALDAAAAKLRQALRDPKRSDVTALARALDAQVMQPVRKLLGETKHVLLSPDGALNLIPFAALVDEEKRYLVERYSLSYLTSGRDLLRLQTHSQSTQGPLVLADPDFGGATGPAVPPEAATTGRAFDLSQAYFTPLPGTAQEAQALQALLPQATVLTRDKATEAALKQANSPSILHIATHGFFLEEATVSSASDGQRLLLQQANAPTPGLKLENPLLRSGLGLAGANLRQSGTDDGILTALEVAGLNLWGTKLVVLSACDTGVGEVKTGEGVYGLRRALVLAGSETQVMSLWPVSDKGTRDLMTEYYKALQAGQGRGEGLRQVQLKLLTDPKRAHPYYWASFIQSGEWANLEGKR